MWRISNWETSPLLIFINLSLFFISYRSHQATTKELLNHRRPSFPNYKINLQPATQQSQIKRNLMQSLCRRKSLNYRPIRYNSVYFLILYTLRRGINKNQLFCIVHLKTTKTYKLFVFWIKARMSNDTGHYLHYVIVDVG